MYPIKTKVPYNPATLDKDWMTYTTAYLGNYVANDFAENVGSHPGVDIVPVTPHDTVVSVLPGIVKMAIEDNAYGKHIVIAHAGVPDPKSDSGTTTLYSCYLHLSDMCVTV
jgi:murein DD-endopeptidase MepM/ murein hydrolase activator NlpD